MKYKCWNKGSNNGICIQEKDYYRRKSYCEKNSIVKSFYNIFILTTFIFVFWADLCSESFERRAS